MKIFFVLAAFITVTVMSAATALGQPEDLATYCLAYSRAVSYSLDGYARVRTNERDASGTMVFDAPSLDKLGFKSGFVQRAANPLYDGKQITNDHLMLLTRFATADDAQLEYLRVRTLIGKCSPTAAHRSGKQPGFIEREMYLVEIGSETATIAVTVIETQGKFVTTMSISSPRSLGQTATLTSAKPVSDATTSADPVRSARGLLEIGKYDNALAVIEPALANKPADPSLLGLRAVIRLEEKRGPDSSADIAKALTASPRNTYALLARGLTKQAAKDHSGAIDDFSASIASDASNALAYRERAWSAWKLDRPIASVLDDYDRAIERMPESVGTLIDAGDACRIDKGPFQRCLAYYEKALKMQPDRGIAHFGRGELYFYADDPRDQNDKAFQRELANGYQVAVADDPKNIKALKHGGYYLHQLKDNESAIAMFTKAIDLGDKDAWTLQMRGSAKRVLGRYREALDDYDQALALDPKNEPALKWRASVVESIAREQSSASARTTRNNNRSALADEAQDEYDKLVAKLRDLDRTYDNAKRKIDRANEIDRKNKDVGNLDSFMGGEYRKAQAALDRAHQLIKEYLRTYGSVIDDATRADIQSWNDRLPTYTDGSGAGDDDD